MYFSILLSLFHLLIGITKAHPSPTFNNFFDDPSIPLINDPIFNISHTTTIGPHSKRSSKLLFTKFNIQLNGINQGNVENFISPVGVMYIIQGALTPGTTNGRNPFDLFVIVGDPANAPQKGAIRYMSNRYLYRFLNAGFTAPLLDFATVRASNSKTTQTISVTVDSGLAALNMLSAFDSPTVFLPGFSIEDVFLIIKGTFTIRAPLKGLVISGDFNLIGKEFIDGDLVPYRALLNGQAVGKGSIVI